MKEAEKMEEMAQIEAQEPWTWDMLPGMPTPIGQGKPAEADAPVAQAVNIPKPTVAEGTA